MPHRTAMPVVLESLPLDALVRVSSYLQGPELGKLQLTSKSWLRMDGQVELWRATCESCDPEVAQSLWSNICFGSNIGVHASMAPLPEVKELSREISCLHGLRKAEWTRSRYHSLSSADQLDAMEAHTMTSLCQRYLVVVAGWGQGEVSNVYVIDGMALPHALVLLHVREVQSPPRFRYGFSAVSHGSEVLVFGGCRFGGYSGECEDFYTLRLVFIEGDEEVPLTAATCQRIRSAPIGAFAAVRAEYSPNLSLRSTAATSSYRALPRAYHSAVVVKVDHRDVMLVWGGLHGRAPTQRLELMDIQSLTWTAGNADGQQPSPRFGHSCVALPCSGSADKLIITGGSDGNDLLRNGSELKDVHVLLIMRSQGRSDRMTWSRVQTENVSLIPGRCHTACALGENQIICFGGGASNSSRVVLMDFTGGADSGDMRTSIQCLTANGEAPVKRVSSAAVIMGGRYMIAFGGWNNQFHELGDVWALDLCPGREAHPRHVYTACASLADANAFLQQRSSKPSVQQDDDDEEEDGDEERSDDDAEQPAQGGGGGGFMQMLLQTLAQHNGGNNGFAAFVNAFGPVVIGHGEEDADEDDEDDAHA